MWQLLLAIWNKCMRWRRGLCFVGGVICHVVFMLLLQINIHILGTESHTLDLIGNKFKTPVLSSFVSLWISLFSHSPKTKALRKRIHRKSMASFSKTRWWSQWEVMHQMMVQFGDVMPFLTNADLGSSVTHSNLLAMVQNTQQH